MRSRWTSHVAVYLVRQPKCLQEGVNATISGRPAHWMKASWYSLHAISSSQYLLIFFHTRRSNLDTSPDTDDYCQLFKKLQSEYSPCFWSIQRLLTWMSRQTICFKDTNHIERLVVLLPESSQQEEMTVESRPAPPDPILPLPPAAPLSNATPLSRHKASTVPLYRPKCIKKLHLPCQHINLFLITINLKTDRQSRKSNKTVLPALFQIWTNLCELGLAFE